jgi:uncharacterized protein (TIGR00266 family)
MSKWYYLGKQNQQVQTVQTELPALVQRGELSPTTLVWTPGMGPWTPASEVLPALFQSSPPPSPAGGGFGGPPPVPQGFNQQRSHEIEYEIIGDDLQIVEIELDPGETVIAEAGGMNYMEDDIHFETRMGDGSQPGGGFMSALKNVGKRMLTGESLFMTHFTHRGSSGKRRVAFAAPYPGKIIPMRLSEFGGEIICEKDAFLCAALGTEVGIAFNRKLGTGFFGGEGFILQRLRGDGLVFVHAGGTIVKKELRGGTLRVDTGCLVAMTSGINYDIQRAGNLKSMVFGGEGLFLATLSGHGTVWLQSLPFSRLADRILANAPSAGGASTGEGSVLGGLGRLLDGK